MMQATSAPADVDVPGPSSFSSLVPLPAFSDNYIWMARRQGLAAVVDPGQAEPVLRALREQGLQLRAILLTHHHQDHVGGVLELSLATGAVVYGPANESLPRCDVALKEGDHVRIGELDLAMDVLDVPGHTAGHIAYFGRIAGVEPVLFCGDTLFAGAAGGFSRERPPK